MKKSINQHINFRGISLTVKREDKLYPEISGNKFRKLKYNLLEAKEQKKSTLVTFGGAYSNHIAATAVAGKEFDFKTIGIIRGEELKNEITKNATLSYAQSCGMQLEFISRDLYRKKNDADFFETLKKIAPIFEELKKDFYLIPEGGTNQLAIKGCEEILTEEDAQYDYICTCVGTGGTISGLINSAISKQKILGFSALKGDFLKDEIAQLTPKKNWELITAYHFGGYGKIKPELITFMNQFKDETGIPLDPIYTGKMLYGIVEKHRAGYFTKGSKILVVHTGGLQGIKGMNQKLRQQKLPIIE